MLAQISGRSSFGLSTLPRSPPVQVTTSTSTPSATYFAMVAAPLLDSSSGCACTAIRRSCSATAGPPRRTPCCPQAGPDLPGRRGRRRRCHEWAAGRQSTPPFLPMPPTTRRGDTARGPQTVTPQPTPVFPPGRYGRRREPGRRRAAGRRCWSGRCRWWPALGSLDALPAVRQPRPSNHVAGDCRGASPTPTVTVRVTVHGVAGEPARCRLRARDYGGVRGRLRRGPGRRRPATRPSPARLPTTARDLRRRGARLRHALTAGRLRPETVHDRSAARSTPPLVRL